MAYTISAWGFQSTTLTDTGGTTYSPSDWGYQETLLKDPVTGSPSPWGYANTKLRIPHHPVGVFDGTTIAYVPVETLIGDATV